MRPSFGQKDLKKWENLQKRSAFLMFIVHYKYYPKIFVSFQ